MMDDSWITFSSLLLFGLRHRHGQARQGHSVRTGSASRHHHQLSIGRHHILGGSGQGVPQVMCWG